MFHFASPLPRRKPGDSKMVITIGDFVIILFQALCQRVDLKDMSVYKFLIINSKIFGLGFLSLGN